MKILLTGSTGQLGYELRRNLFLWGDVLAPSRQELDLLDMAAVERWLEEHAPNCIINTAAYTSVDKAENDPQGAFRLNQILPATLARYAAEKQIRLFHYSTDYVYDGSGHRARSEDALPNPLNIYGQSKLAGDQAIMNSGAPYVIFRTSWLYAARGNNFLLTLLQRANEQNYISVVSDQIGAPTSARLLAEVTTLVMAHKNFTPGIYHVACRGETSWYGFACQILYNVRQLSKNLQLSNTTILPISTNNYGAPAARPLNSRLSVEKIEKMLHIHLPHWKEALSLTLDEIL